MDWRNSNGDAREHNNGPVPSNSNLGNGVNTDNANARPVDDSSLTAAPFIECLADVRVLAQSVNITDISFAEESFKVNTDLTIVPLVPDLTVLKLHLGKYALLPSETMGGFTGSVKINDIEATYSRMDPYQSSCNNIGSYRLSEMNNACYNSLKNDDSQLLINIPKQLSHVAHSMGTLFLSIDVLVRRPKLGVQFSYAFSRDGSLEKGAHLFTYKSSLMSATHEWLPCLDAPDQLALWKLTITCDTTHTAIASAELVDVELSADMSKKVYTYQQSVPTAACNMGWAIGHFQTYGHPDMTEVTSFGLPGLIQLVKHTVSPLDKILEYFEELLSCRYPYPSYKQVFVDKTPDEVTSYSSLTIFSVNILYHKKIIDVVQESRQHIAVGLAQQFFGCFISPAHWLEWWLVKSLAKLASTLYVEKVFGTSEFMYQIKNYMDEVIDYESQWGKVLLRPLLQSPPRTNLHCDSRHELTCSQLYAETSWKKGLLAMRMLLKRIGHEPFFQVLHKILTVGQQSSERRDRPISWTHMILSTDSFFRTVTSVTGNEIPTFLEQWICTGGHASFQLQYSFNRRRNMIELEVKQDLEEGNGRLRYLGPLTVVVQELDGPFTHTVQIDNEVSRSDLQCHSKGRRQKKKKVPLYTGEEVEVDLTNMDPDSPVLWIRADPEHLLLRQMLIRQPIYQWEYMLKYERDVIAQMTAIDRLQQFPSPQSRNVLLETISSDFLFYRIRCRASDALSTVLNRMSEAWSGKPDLIEYFRKLFGSRSCPSIPRSNNFVATSQNLQQYFLMQTLPQAVAKIRTQANGCLPEVLTFVLELIKFNDNSTNRYADDHYRAALVTALTNTIVPSHRLGSVQTPDSLNADADLILQELTLALNMDTLKPSYGKVVGIAALRGIYEMQKNNHLPHDSKIFWLFASPKICLQMRLAAIDILIDRLSSLREKIVVDDFLRLLSMAEDDSDPSIRYFIPKELAKKPPFTSQISSETGNTNPCNTVQVTDQIWRLMQCADPRARTLFSDLYFSMYGLGTPVVKGGILDTTSYQRLIRGSGGSSFLSSTLDDDRADSPLGDRNNSFTEDTLQ